MAYVNYNPQENYYDLIKGIFNQSREITEEEIRPDIGLLFEGQNIAGVRVRNFFEKNEILGAMGEEYIKSFMAKNGIPYLYVGQGPTGVQKSEVLKSDMQAHRPDFLIHLPDIGTLFFDVKCRRRLSFNEKKGDGCFYLFKSEMESLIKLHFSLLVPVWIAFIDTEAISRKEAVPTLHLVCASQLHAFWEGMKAHLSEKESRALGTIRLPGVLFQEIREKLEFKIGMQNVPTEVTHQAAVSHQGMIRRIEDEIRGFIRSNKAMKSNFARTMLKAKRLLFLRDADVTAAIHSMIKDNIIQHEPRQPLSLAGE